VAIQPDGKIVTAGFAGERARFALAHFNRKRHAGCDLQQRRQGVQMVRLQCLRCRATNDGKIVAAGLANLRDCDCTSFAVARYTPDGALDATFGGDGKVTTNITKAPDSANAVAVQPDGRIVAAGQARNGFGLARYLP
jgi:uncharacterized delta-60 repeat protein